MKFIRTEVNQRLIQKDGKTYKSVKVTGYLYGNSGLNIVKGYKCWTTSHERSGKLIFDLPLTFALTKKVVTILAKVIDWTRHEDEVLEQAILGSKQSEIFKQIRLIKSETATQTIKKIEQVLKTLDDKPIKPFWHIDEN